MLSESAEFGPGPQPADEEGVPGAPVLPPDPPIRDGPQAGVHRPEDLHLQGETSAPASAQPGEVTQRGYTLKYIQQHDVS